MNEPIIPSDPASDFLVRQLAQQADLLACPGPLHRNHRAAEQPTFVNDARVGSAGSFGHFTVRQLAQKRQFPFLPWVGAHRPPVPAPPARDSPQAQKPLDLPTRLGVEVFRSCFDNRFSWNARHKLWPILPDAALSSSIR